MILVICFTAFYPYIFDAAIHFEKDTFKMASNLTTHKSTLGIDQLPVRI
jgi:hypothetical protein